MALDKIPNSTCIVCGSKNWYTAPSVTQAIRSLFDPAIVVRCPRCGLGRLEPMPSQDAIHSVYESERYAESYESVGQSFVISEETAREQLTPRFQRLASYLPRKGRLLDIGASRGVFLKLAALEGWSIFGLEASQNTIAYAKSHYGIAIEHGTIEESPLRADFYDCVHLSHVLEHLRDPSESIRRISDSMRSGGVLIVEVPLEFGDFFDCFREVVLRRARAENTVPSSHLYFFSRRSLCRLLAKSGFEILYTATPRRNRSLESAFPLGKVIKSSVYRLEQLLKQGPLIEVFARKR